MAGTYEREICDETGANEWAERVTANLASEYEITRAFDCHVDNWDRLEGEVKRLSKKAIKLGYVPPLLLRCAFDHVVVRLEDVRDDEGIVRTVQRHYRMTKCVVAGQELRLKGWTIVAAVDWLDRQPVVRSLPGREITPGMLTELRIRGPWCSHCQQTRSRNTTYVLVNELGSQYQIGSTCLKDFCGIDPGYAAQAAALYQPGGYAAGARYEDSLDDWLGWWCLATRLAGRFVSRAQAEREQQALYDQYEYGKAPVVTTTVQDAYALYQSGHNNPNAPRPEQVDRDLAEKVKGWVATLDPDLGQYHANLLAIYQSGILLPRHDGLAASAIGAYLREEAKAAEAAARAASQRPSQYLGQPGQRVQVKVKVVSCYVSEGAYGTTWIYRLVTPEGDKATWFSSREVLEVGQEVELVGTIKKLEEYRGEQQTVLTRCREV